MVELVISNSNFRTYTGDGKVARFGGEDRLLTALPRVTRPGLCSFAPNRLKLIPRDLWKPMVDEKDAEGTWLHDLIKGVIPCCNQNGLGYCATADTEVMTERGWTPWPEYNWADLLGTVNLATGLLEFQAPLKRHVYEYDGPMVYSTNRRLDFGMTPDHRMLVRKWDESKRTLSDQYTFQRAGSLGWYCGMMPSPKGFIGTEIKRAQIEDDREYDGDDFVAMLSLICSDGFAGGSASTKNWVSFCCFREDRHEIIDQLARRIGFREQPSRRGVWRRTDAPALAAWIRSNCYTSPELSSRNKKVPAIIKELCGRQIRHFLDFYGDQRHSGKTEGLMFYSSSKRMVDDLQELHLRIGKRSSICSRGPRTSRFAGKDICSSEEYTLVVSTTDSLCIDRKKHIEVEPYKGLVYCATVPNGTLVTRRNGSVLISGNCHAYGTTHPMMAHRLSMGLSYIHLSAESIGGEVTGWRNEGGALDDDLRVACELGACEESFMDKPHSINPGRWKDGWKENRKKYRVTEWWELDGRGTFDAVATCALLGIPCNTGFGWWGHAITGGLRLRFKDGLWQLMFRNSWGPDFGDDGFFWMGEDKGTPDLGCFGVREMVATAA